MFMEGNTWEGENVEWGRNTAELKFKKIYEFITIHQAIFLHAPYMIKECDSEWYGREEGEWKCSQTALVLRKVRKLSPSSVDRVDHQRHPSLVLDSIVMDFRVLYLSILLIQQDHYYSASAFGIMLSCLPVCSSIIHLN